MKPLLAGCLALIALIALPQTPACGQAPARPLAPSDTSTPRATFNSFLSACDELSAIWNSRSSATRDRSAWLPAAERILDCLDVSELPPDLRETGGLEAAVYLREILDRIPLPPDEQIPAATAAEDGTDDWRVPGTRLRIARTRQGPAQGEFQFTAASIRRVSTYYAMIRERPYRSSGRAVTPGFRGRFVAATRSEPQLSANNASPRGTMALFLSSMNEVYAGVRQQRVTKQGRQSWQPLIQQILGCLDTTDLPEFSREWRAGEAAVCIKEILDRVPLPPVEQIPGAESLELTGAGTMELTHWQVPGTRLAIGRVAEGPRQGAWLFTTETVRRAPGDYEKIRTDPYRTGGPPVSAGFYNWWLATPGSPATAAVVNWLPESFQNRAGGMALWQWLGVLFSAPACLLLMFLGFRCGWRAGRNPPASGHLRYWINSLLPAATLLVPFLFEYIVERVLTVRGQSLYVLIFLTNACFLLALVYVVFTGCVRVAHAIASRPGVRSGSLDSQLIHIVGRLLGVVSAGLVLLEGGRYLGFPVTTLLASAGVGGLAVALAGQSMLKGLFGTLTIMMDKPFREGERIQVRGYDGLVEEIGLRSTKIRSFLTNHLVAIPNDQMADSEIENIGRRQFFRRTADLHIPIDSSREKVEQAITIIRDILDNHEGMLPDRPPWIHFTDFLPDAFNIQFVYWFQPAEFLAYREFSQKVNLEIFRRFEAAGIQFSLPVRHSYWRQDDQQGPLDIRLADLPAIPGLNAGTTAPNET